jgi:SSS family solute:Na+ symporter
MRTNVSLSPGLLILPLYFAITVLIGWLAGRKNRDANAYLNASRSLPLPIVVAAYLAANCGALEIVGLSAMAAQYGVQAFHFYFIGAIPGMIFLALWMMPVYRRSGIRSLPEYLERRYGSKARLLNACAVAITMLLLAGVSLYAMAQVLQVVIGLNFVASILASATVVLTYVLLGGVRATIYNEVSQLAVMIVGLVPLAIRSAYLTKDGVAHNIARDHLWKGTPLVSRTAPLDVIGIVLGLGFVLSFSYWSTDFILMQRAFSARTDAQARQVPLWAGFGKLLFSLLVVLPGLAAFRLIPQLGRSLRFDQALPALMKLSYGPTMFGLGLTALAASLMSGLAANISAFAAIWTEDIYHSHIQKHRPDGHYLQVGRVAAITAMIVSILASYINFFFRDLMEHVQLIFSVLGAPFFAIFLLGMGTRRTTEKGAVVGFLSGAGVALLHLFAFRCGWLHYGSAMSANFYIAIYAFCTTAGVAWIVSNSSRHAELPEATGLIFHWRTGLEGKGLGLLWILSIALLSSCLALNLLWR